MPSISAKVEKQPSSEVCEPLKQAQNLVEKKIRNLEKRKTRLELLKEEANSGKTLHDDQKKAIAKYDDVQEMLEFFKDFSKNVNNLFAEHNKLAKKLAKKEQLDRKQAETERLKSIIVYQDILNSFDDDVKKDFKAGSNGALKLSDERLNQLDEFYKLVLPDRSRYLEESFDKQVDNSAKRLFKLVEGSSAVVFGSITFKDMKELLTSIGECGYFNEDKSTAKKASEAASEKTVKDGNNVGGDFDGVTKLSLGERSSEVGDISGGYPNKSRSGYENVNIGNLGNGSGVPTSGTGSSETGFSFLQESRLDAPDSSVVTITPMQGTYAAPYGRNESVEALAAQLASGMQIPMSSTSAVKTGVTYENSTHQPIPTQTFTNQNFAAMMAATTFVPTVTIPNPQMLGLPVQMSGSGGGNSSMNEMDSMQGANSGGINHMMMGSKMSTYQENYCDYPDRNQASRDKGNYGDYTYRGGHRRGGRGTGHNSVNGYPRRGNRDRRPERDTSNRGKPRQTKSTMRPVGTWS